MQKSGGLNARRIVISGVLAAVTMLLGATGLGFIPVPTPAGSVTIMHVPAIIGGIMEGWLVGAIIGTIFGIFSWLQSPIPLFKDPRVAVFPRIFIGVTAYFTYAILRRFIVAVIPVETTLRVPIIPLPLIRKYSIAIPINEYIALVGAAVVGTLTNTVLVLTMAVMTGYMATGVAVGVAVTHGPFEVIVAAIIVVAVVAAWKRIETGGGKARM
jgi:uncharacterized membrane protein